MEHPTLPDREFKPYLDRIARGLDRLPAAEREDVLREIRSHLEDGLAAGEPASVLLERMGAPESVAEAMLSERLVAVERRRSPLQLAAIVLQAAAIPLVLVLVIFGVLELIYWKASTNPEPWTADKMFANWTVLAALMMPWILMVLGTFGLPKLHRELSASLFRRMLPYLTAVIMGLSVLVTAGAYAVADGAFQSGSGKRGELSDLQARREKARERLQAQSPHNYRALDRARETFEDLDQQYTLYSSLPLIHLGAAALGLSLGYLLRRRAFLWVCLAAGGGALVLTISAMLMFAGSMTSPFAIMGVWGALSFQWLVVVALWGLGQYLEARRVQ